MGKIAQRISLEARLAANRLRLSDARKIRWGIVGPGYMGEQFARVIGLSDMATVSAVFSRSEERARKFAHRHGASECFSDFDAFLAALPGVCDVVYVATPAQTHDEIVEACLKRGANVLCEKPLCPSAERARELYEIASNHSALLFEGMWSYCLPTFDRAQAWMDARVVGNLVGIHVELCKDQPTSDADMMLDYGVYPLAFARRFAGCSFEYATLNCSRNSAGRVNHVVAEGVSPEGIQVSVTISQREAADNSAVLLCERGNIVFGTPFNRTNKVYVQDARDEVLEQAVFTYKSMGFEYELSQVCACLSGSARETCALSPELGCKTLEDMERMRASR